MATTVKPIPVNYKRPFVTEYQREIMDRTQRFAAIEASTKCGKTAMAIIKQFEKTLPLKRGQKTLWVAPVHAQSKIAFDRMKNQINDRNFFTINESRLDIELKTGGIICFRSGDNPDSLYGEDYYYATVDEASRTKESTWTAVRSTLTATQGKALLIGNVKGRKNYFHKLCMKAKSGQALDWFYKKITAYDAVDAGILAVEEIESAKRDLPENVFKELYLAEPSEDGSNPFGINHIAGCIVPLSTEPAICYGIDLAKSIDWTVIIGLDRNAQVCDFRTFQKPWEETFNEILSLPNVPMAMDSTGVGDSIHERVSREKNEVEGFVFSSRSKQQLMEGLSVAVQKRLIGFPEGIIRDQMESFEYEYSRTGGVKYSAPSNEHDDAVCALALAWHKWQTALSESGGPSIW